MKVEAFKCERTGELFATQAAYDKHVRALAKEDRRQSVQRAVEEAHQQRLEFVSNASSLEELETRIVAAYNDAPKEGDLGRSRKPSKLLHVAIRRIDLRNARRLSEHPVLRGDIEFTYDRDPPFGMEVRQVLPLLETGTGGHRSSPTRKTWCCGYDFTLHLEKFPKLYAQFQEYHALLVKHAEHRDRVQERVNELCAQDAVLTALKEQEREVDAQIAKLQAQRDGILSQMRQRVQFNQATADQESVFDGEARLAAIEKAFRR